MDLREISTLTPPGYPVGGCRGHFRDPILSKESIEPIFSPIGHPWAALEGVFGGLVETLL